MTRHSLYCELFLFPCKTMVLLTDDSALLLWSMPTHEGHYVRCPGTMLLPVSDMWRFVMVIKSSKVFFLDQKWHCSVRFWGLWALGDLWKDSAHVCSFNSHRVQMVWVTALRWRDDALTPNPPNFVFPSRCVTGCTRWHQTPQCCWRTPGSICSLTPWLTPQGPLLESSCPLNCPLLTERHLMTSWHNKLTSGFRSGFAVWCLSFSSKISKLQTSSSVVYAVSSLNTSRCKTVMVWIIKAFFSSLVTTFRYVCDLSGCGVQKYLGLFFLLFLFKQLVNKWISL